MDTLKELKEWILEDPDRRVGCLVDADFYLVQYDLHPTGFCYPPVSPT